MNDFRGWYQQGGDLGGAGARAINVDGGDSGGSATTQAGDGGTVTFTTTYQGASVINASGGDQSGAGPATAAGTVTNPPPGTTVNANAGMS